MKNSLKQEINKQLCHMAREIQVHSNSAIVWGETKLPECLRKEIEEASKETK